MSSQSQSATGLHYALVQCAFSLSYWFALSSHLRLPPLSPVSLPLSQLSLLSLFSLLLFSRSRFHCSPKRAPVHDTSAPPAASAAASAPSAALRSLLHFAHRVFLSALFAEPHCSGQSPAPAPSPKDVSLTLKVLPYFVLYCLSLVCHFSRAVSLMHSCSN